MTDDLEALIGSPLCIACNHCDWPSFATGSQAVIEITATCFHPDVAAAFSPVSGPGYGKPCSAARRDLACGPDGRLFERKGANSP